MAKGKRKLTAAQQNKDVIALAKKLKQKGILSKQTKLHQGRYVSRNVLKKVQVFQSFASSDYTTIKVPKGFAKNVKQEGYTVVQGNRIIVPRDHDFIKKVRSGVIGGVRPVKGGQIIEINMPWTIATVQDLVDKLENGDIEYLKKPDELFIFSFLSERTGEHHTSKAAFQNQDSLRRYLERYRIESIPFSYMKTFRIKKEDVRMFIPNAEQRRRDSIRRRRLKLRTVQDRREVGKRPMTAIEKMELNNPRKAEKMKKDRAAKARAKREELFKDPAKLAEYRAKGLARALKSRANKEKK